MRNKRIGTAMMLLVLGGMFLLVRAGFELKGPLVDHTYRFLAPRSFSMQAIESYIAQGDRAREVQDYQMAMDQYQKAHHIFQTFCKYDKKTIPRDLRQTAQVFKRLRKEGWIRHEQWYEQHVRDLSAAQMIEHHQKIFSQVINDKLDTSTRPVMFLQHLEKHSRGTDSDDDGEGLLRLAWLLFEQGDLEYALELSDRILQHQPSLPVEFCTRLLRTKIYRARKEYFWLTESYERMIGRARVELMIAQQLATKLRIDQVRDEVMNHEFLSSLAEDGLDNMRLELDRLERALDKKDEEIRHPAKQAGLCADVTMEHVPYLRRYGYPGRYEIDERQLTGELRPGERFYLSLSPVGGSAQTGNLRRS